MSRIAARNAALRRLQELHSEDFRRLLAEEIAARRPPAPPKASPAPEPQAALLAIYPDAARALGGLGRTKLYELIASGELRTVKIGRRRFVPTSAIEEYVTRLEAV